MNLSKNVNNNKCWYSSMKKKFRKIPMIFDIENWLWKSNLIPIPNSWVRRSIFCPPHRPNFSDIFDLCIHWVDFTECAHPLHNVCPTKYPKCGHLLQQFEKFLIMINLSILFWFQVMTTLNAHSSSCTFFVPCLSDKISKRH